MTTPPAARSAERPSGQRAERPQAAAAGAGDRRPRVWQPLRSQVARVGCPYCGAAAGQPCVRLSGQPRKRHHLQRVELVWSAENRAPRLEARPPHQSTGSAPQGATVGPR